MPISWYDLQVANCKEKLTRLGEIFWTMKGPATTATMSLLALSCSRAIWAVFAWRAISDAVKAKACLDAEIAGKAASAASKKKKFALWNVWQRFAYWFWSVTGTRCSSILILRLRKLHKRRRWSVSWGRPGGFEADACRCNRTLRSCNVCHEQFVQWNLKRSIWNRAPPARRHSPALCGAWLEALAEEQHRFVQASKKLSKLVSSVLLVRLVHLGQADLLTKLWGASWQEELDSLKQACEQLRHPSLATSSL